MGFNHIDLDAAKKENLVVTNTPEVLTDCTADIAMTLLLAAARRTSEGERELRAGNGLAGAQHILEELRLLEKNTEVVLVWKNSSSYG